MPRTIPRFSIAEFQQVAKVATSYNYLAHVFGYKVPQIKEFIAEYGIETPNIREKKRKEEAES